MKPILEIKGISKKFKIRHEQQPYLSVRDSISGIFKKRTSAEDFWALKDVSFDVLPGDTIGIIGKNGAGKSTLLKILSKITPPTKGKVISRGRIASLLEVGTGFHPELSGRENIFLNGSILGMKKFEILRNFDAIVDFAGVERFIDTPLKHYSSGMQLRLAFAVAAFLENEVLIIDEVLAVGDAEFQKKCMGKMENVSKSGRTIILVSHSMNAIQSLAEKAVYIESGTTEGIITVQSAVQKYLYGNETENAGFQKFEPSLLNKEAVLLEGRVLDSKRAVSSRLETCEDIFVQVVWENLTGLPVTVSVEMVNYMGVQVFWAADVNLDRSGAMKKEKGVYTSTVRIPKHLINAGEYFFRLVLYNAGSTQLLDLRHNILNIAVVDPMDDRCIARGNFTAQFENYVLLPALEWELEKNR